MILIQLQARALLKSAGLETMRSTCITLRKISMLDAREI